MTAAQQLLLADAMLCALSRTGSVTNWWQRDAGAPLPACTRDGAYARYLLSHGRALHLTCGTTCCDNDGTLQYILQRYREVHGLWHVLADLPPTVPQCSARQL